MDGEHTHPKESLDVPPLGVRATIHGSRRGWRDEPPICYCYEFATDWPSKNACVVPSISTLGNTHNICFLEPAFYLRKLISSQPGARHGVIFLDCYPG